MKALTWREVNLYHRCIRKKSYANLGDARRKAHQARVRTGENIEHYICRDCGQFHIGHVRK